MDRRLQATAVAAQTVLLVLAWRWGAWSSRYGLWVWAALSLVWAAEALLLSREARLWRVGLLAAVGARAAYAVAMIGRGPTVWVAVAAAVAVGFAAWAFVLRPILSASPRPLRRTVGALVGVLVAFVGSAAGAADATGRWSLLLAALLLLVADLVLARHRFVRRDGLGLAGLVLGVAAHLLLAASVR